ncbi:outer membrane protein assembly factor BamD [Siccirubricoccus deserti]
MAAYGEYQRNRYTEAIGALDRFIQLHPAHRDIAYAYYLRALCYYEQITDAQRDQRTTEQAMAALQDVVNRFPDTAYARDARLKIDLGRDHLAGKEMNIGRFYQRQRLYGAAIGRFKRVVEDFQTTNHVPEALHRLTEIYLALGLPEEAKATASVLGHISPAAPGTRTATRCWSKAPCRWRRSGPASPAGPGTGSFEPRRLAHARVARAHGPCPAVPASLPSRSDGV